MGGVGCVCGGITFTRAPALSSNSTVEILPSCAATMRGVSLVSVLASILAPLMHGAGKSNNGGGGGRTEDRWKGWVRTARTRTVTDSGRPLLPNSPFISRKFVSLYLNPFLVFIFAVLSKKQLGERGFPSPDYLIEVCFLGCSKRGTITSSLQL